MDTPGFNQQRNQLEAPRFDRGTLQAFSQGDPQATVTPPDGYRFMLQLSPSSNFLLTTFDIDPVTTNPTSTHHVLPAWPGQYIVGTRIHYPYASRIGSEFSDKIIMDTCEPDGSRSPEGLFVKAILCGHTALHTIISFAHIAEGPALALSPKHLYRTALPSLQRSKP